MKCPHCPDATLVISERSGIEIDYCPVCRGVWLDRGELDKLIERSMAAAVPATAPQPARLPSPAPSDVRYERRDRDDDDYYDDDDDWKRDGKPRRKKSFLGEIFDF